MKKNTINFWTNILTFINFIFVIFTGILLREFPAELSGATLLSAARKEWVDLHWMLSLLLLLFIFTHLVLHWGWAKGTFRKYLRVGPRALAITATLIVLLAAVVAPVYLTKDLPNRKDVKSAYYEAGISSLEERIHPASPFGQMTHCSALIKDDIPTGKDAKNGEVYLAVHLKTGKH
ncbi:MAG: DUF4405 domain-containing protein [Deltaproteobacteria bacterium]|nr:DUF4405 domain-containing protein [Deltaproteobacteria bacterium]